MFYYTMFDKLKLIDERSFILIENDAGVSILNIFLCCYILYKYI